MADPRVLFGYRSTRSEAHQCEHPDMGWTINNSWETVANIHTEWHVDLVGRAQQARLQPRIRVWVRKLQCWTLRLYNRQCS